MGRASGIVPGNVKFLEAEEETGAATRELIRILTIPPLLPFRALQRDEARPNPPGEEALSTLGISGAHPLWIEREKRNVWDEVVSDSFPLDDISVRPSPIQVEPCASSSWLDEMFSDTSSNSVMTGLDKIFIPTNQENRKCYDSEPATTERASPLEWMMKLYQPMLRATKDLPVCGNLGQVVFEDAPFFDTQVNNDTSRVPLGDIRNTRATRHEPVPRPLKPCPKDTPSIQQVYLPRTSPWETFQ
jgi:hypothetical protein